MMKENFLKNGYSALPNLISMNEVQEIRKIYQELLDDKERTEGLRSDLSGSSGSQDEVEKITQIMVPSRIEPKLLQLPVYKIALNWAKDLLGDDMELDFDMLINKAPHTNTETPWHQDAAYWIKMPDKRSASCWIALDEVYEENGCMWFVPKKSDEVLPHSHKVEGGALSIDGKPENARPVPLEAGGCTFHDGFTLHFSKGNSTDGPRRALILNFRPQKMIDLERQQGMDHTGNREFRK